MPKGDRMRNKNTNVEVPVMGGSEIAIPEWFATPTKKGWRLVNPLTDSRNLSRRKGQLSIKLLRKPVEDMIIMEHQTEPIPLSQFSPKDRKIIDEHFKVVEKNKGKELTEIPTAKVSIGLDRGRPEYLPANVEHNRAKGVKANKTKRVYIAEKKANEEAEEEAEKPPGRKRGRKPIYKTEEERREAIRAHNRKSYRRLKGLAPGEEAAEGTGILDNINSFANKIVDTAKKTTKAVGDYADVVLHGRNDYPPKVRDLLKKFGNDILESMEIVRAPVPSLLTGALSIVSGGQFGKNLANSPYDTLFHLRIDIKTQNGNKFLIEKNEVINMERNPSLPKDAEKKVVQPISAISINVMLENTHKLMGGKFFTYSARDNNCQDFILAILTANHFGNDTDRNFVKQNTKELFANMPALRKFSNTITDIGAKVNEITTGRGITDLVIHHFQKDNKEMKQLSNAYKKHLKTEKMTGRGMNNDSSDSDTDSDSGSDSSSDDGTGSGFRHPKHRTDNDVEAESLEDDEGRGLFSKIKWGSLTKQFKIFKRKHKDCKTLEQFSQYIINHPTEFHKRTLKRAEFYLNVIDKKKISTNNIMSLGDGIHHHHYHSTEIDGNGIVHHHHHHIVGEGGIGLHYDHVMTGGKLSKIGQAFNKAFNPKKNGVAKAVNNVVNDVKNDVVAPAEKALTPNNIVNGLKVVGHYAIPAITSGLGGLAGAALAPESGPLGAMAGSALGAYGGQQIDRALGIQNNTSFDGKGLRKAKFAKGSAEAKEHMAKLRAMRKGGSGLYASGKKGGSGLYSGSGP